MTKQQNEDKHNPRASKRQRSGRKQWKLIYTIIIIVVAVVVLGGAGWGFNYYQDRAYRQPAVVFNGHTYDLGYFVDSAKLYYGNAPPDTSIADFADYVEQQIERNQTTIQGAALLGVQIDRSNIADDLKISGKKATPAQVDITMAQKLILKEVPPIQPQYNLQVMLLESEAAAQAAMARVKSGEEFVNVSAAVSKRVTGLATSSDIGWVTPRQADIVLDSSEIGNVIANAPVGVLSGPVYDATTEKKIGYWVLKAIDKTEATDNTTLPQVHINGILLGSEQEAEEVIKKLNAGADMNELAKQVSQLPTANVTGAEIAWISKSQDPSEFDALFNSPLNTIIGPLTDNTTQTKGGYWVYNILEKNNSLELTDNQKNLLESDFYDRCAAALAKNPDYKVENLLDQKKKDFALNEVVLAQGKGSVLIGVTSLPNAEVGANYSANITIYGDTRGNSWNITSGSLPEGLSLDALTGIVSGVPKYGGGSGFTVQVGNSLHFNSQEMFINIRLPLSITSTTLPDGQVGTDYVTVIEIFDNGFAYSWSIISGSLPDGLSLNQYTGQIKGNPTTAGTYTFTVQIDDGIKKATKELSILIQ
jgi:hypothetical protein